ncbi:MAG: hypothetical protein Q9217_000474 [Psora testacea]
MTTSVAQLYASPSSDALQATFVGTRLQDVPAPAAILDKAIVEGNCKRMLDACQALRVDFRPHTKTHKRALKTTEVTKLQVGDTTDDVRLVVSTVAEAENLYSYLTLCRSQGKKTNVRTQQMDMRSLAAAKILYGVPLPQPQVPRLARLAKEMGPHSISVMIDHPDQLEQAHLYTRISGSPLQIFIKVDTGYHRAGLSASSNEFHQLVTDVLNHETSTTVQLVGFYSHAGHSYGCDSAETALSLLIDEIQGLNEAAVQAFSGHSRKAILSVGATPTATSIQVLSGTKGKMLPEARTLTTQLTELIDQVQKTYTLELHAGVYPFLDMQQLATQASPSAGQSPAHHTLSTADIALTILVDVNSLYPHRSPPEALIAAGSLALGREPCKSYPGWGVVSDWGMQSNKLKFKEGKSGWQVGRISQEHGILTQDTEDSGHISEKKILELKVGQKIRVWPNHTCVAGAMFGWYLVVDSRLKGREDEVVEVWVRWRGW